MELGYRHATTAGSDAVAIGNLTAALTLAYRKRYRIIAMVSVSFHDSFWDDPIILLGGRVHNQATEDVLIQFEQSHGDILPFRVEDTPGQGTREIVDVTDGSRYTASIVGEQIVKDYGLIYCFPSPFKSTKAIPVFVFYGLHAYGTVGVSRLVTPEFLKGFMSTRSGGSSGWFQVLVEVEVRNEEVYPKVVVARPIEIGGRQRQRGRPIFGRFVG
jgi:hypothetical protein